MYFDFNLVDLSSVAFMLLYAVLIFRRGFLSQTAEFIGLLLSLVFSIIFFPFFSWVMVVFGVSLNLANSISFIIIWITVGLFILYLFQKAFKKLPMTLILSRFNRYLGIIPNVASSLLIIIFLSTTVTTLPANPSLKAYFTQSRLVGSILSVTSTLNAPLSKAFKDSVRDGIVLLTSKDVGRYQKINFPKSVLRKDFEAEEKLFDWVNFERVKNGLVSLTKDDRLQDAAREHSSEMFQQGYFGHVSPEGTTPYDRVVRNLASFNSLAENISYAPDVNTAFKSFLNSKAHREIFLSPKYTRTGIGIIDSGDYGEIFTQYFAD